MIVWATESFTTIIVFLLVLILTYSFVWWKDRIRDLPPGPTSFPLVGNVLQLIGRDFREVCKDYRKRYGDIFTLRLFSRTLIIVNGYEAVKDVSVKNGDVFSQRLPDMDDLRKGEGVIFSTGEIWKRNKRFVIRTLRDFGMGKSKLQAAIHTEISYFLDALDQQGGQPFDIQYLITTAISNVTCSILFGKRFDYLDEEFINIIRIMDKCLETNAYLKPKCLRYVPGDPFHVASYLDNSERLAAFCKSKVQEHIQSFDANDIRDLIDVYIKQMDLGGTTEMASSVNEDDIVKIVEELYMTGTGTTSTALRYGLICLLNNPGVQEQNYREMKNIVPPNRLPDVNDCRSLPYLQATISEILRRACIGPFSAPYSTKTDVVYQGYTIPKAATVLLNLDSVAKDETTWEEPLVFNPLRFLKENISQEKMEGFIPFGIGPRICAGEIMARMQLNLFLSAMLHRFELLPAESEDPPSLDTKFGATVVLPSFKLRAIKRV